MLKFLYAVSYYLVQAILGLVMAAVIIASAFAPARPQQIDAAPVEIVGASWSYPSGEATVPPTIRTRYAQPGIRMSIARVERITATLSFAIPAGQ